jgi:lysophospholipase L1-like esterase
LKKLVLGDSIIKNLLYIAGTVIVVCSGKNLQFFTQYIKDNVNNLKKYQVITIHAGTNNIRSNKQSDIFQLFVQLIKVFKMLLPTVQLVISPMLPRPRDQYYTGSKVKFINNAVFAFCRDNGVMCIKTFNPFIKFGQPQARYFVDGLHLNDKGNVVLNTFFRDCMSDSFLRARIPALRQETSPDV